MGFWKKLGKFYSGLIGLDALACPAGTGWEFRPADYKRLFWPQIYNNYLTLMLSARQQRLNRCGGNVFYRCARILCADHLSSLTVFHRLRASTGGTGSYHLLLCLGITMASLWSSLEKDVFNPQKKRLLETVRVWKTGKKKKMSILCVVGKNPGDWDTG